MGKALELLKISNDKHKGPFYYINRNRRLGKQPKPMSAEDYMKFKKALKIAHSRAMSRRRGAKQQA